LLDIELQRFFYALGMPMYQGYGLTEAAPISFNCPESHKLGSSGKQVQFLELRICDPEGRVLPTGEKGEIAVRGESVMAGYWKNETATRETIREEWLYTGDLGYLDPAGFLYVLGREKSLLISNDGEKYSPEGIEEAILSSSRLIDQIMLHNNQSAYTIAVVVPSRVELMRLGSETRLDWKNENDLKSILESIQEVVNQFRSGGGRSGIFPSKWLPSALAVVEEGFTEENRLLNSTLKMVRGRILEAYRERIELLFTPEGRSLHSPENLAALRQILGKSAGP
jgi:long-chain acyl-CoA synthetase